MDDIVERNDDVGFPAADAASFDPRSAEGGFVTVNSDGSFEYIPPLDFIGEDSFIYVLSNSHGQDSAVVYINVKERVVELTTLWIPVGIGSDDAEEDIIDGRISLSSSDLELIRDGSTEQLVGVRFQGLNIPRGANIANAYIQYTADENNTEQTDLTVFGEASTNAETFSTTRFNISSRTLTVAQVPWSLAAWNTNEQTSSTQATPDLSVIVQEIVNQGDWVAENSIVFITSGSGKRVAESFNGTAAPVLHVSFSIEPPIDQAPDAPDATHDRYTTGYQQELIVPNGPTDIVESNDHVGIPAADLVTFGPTGVEYAVGTVGMSAKGGNVTLNSNGSFSYTPAEGFSGGDYFGYILRNTEDQSSATVSIEVLADLGLTTLTIPVLTGSDDAEQNSVTGRTNLGSSDLELTRDRSSIQLVGVRFQGVDVPPGAQIEAAYIQYTVDENTSEETILSISGQASVNALTFTNEYHDISSRTATSASVAWTPTAWNTRGVAGLEQRTPDLSTIVQEIVEQAGWAEGNAMVFMTSGSGTRVAESYNGTAAPELHLVYSMPTETNVPPTASNLLITDANGGPLVVGDELTGTYTYNDAEGNIESNSIITWLRDGIPIAGATSTSYTTVTSDGGKDLSLKVTPIAISGASPGVAITSASITVNFQLGGMGPAGGIVFYISDGAGTVGTQGLEITPKDLGSAPWGCYELELVGADGVAIGTGAQNTLDILKGCPEKGIAAEIADQYTLNGFEDWFLPSEHELLAMFDLFDHLPSVGFTGSYWSSSEVSADLAATVFLKPDGINDFEEDGKWYVAQVRAIRAFSGEEPANNLPRVTSVSITDINGELLVVGDLLTGNYLYSDAENDNEASSTFRWLTNGVAIAGATEQSYTPVAADAGKTLTFEVTPVAESGNSPGTRVSSSVVIVEKIVEDTYTVGDIGPAGGIIFYVASNGLSGLEAAPNDLGTAAWGCISIAIEGADGTLVDTGKQNTTDILAGCTDAGIAAEITNQFTLNGFDDWFLPSKDGLNLLFQQASDIGGFDSIFYWTSTENSRYSAWYQSINSGTQGTRNRDVLYGVRAVRAFSVGSDASIIAVNPTNAISGTLVSIEGSGFTPASKVRIGDYPTADIIYFSQDNIAVVVPFTEDNGKMVGLPAGVYPLTVDGSEARDLTVSALPDNPNPPGVVLNNSIKTLTDGFALHRTDIEVAIADFRSQVADDPALIEYLDAFEGIIPIIEKMQVELPSLVESLDPDALDALEKVLWALSQAEPNQIVTPLVETTVKASSDTSLNSLKTILLDSQAITDGSCTSVECGDAWLDEQLNFANAHSARQVIVNILKVCSYVPVTALACAPINIYAQLYTELEARFGFRKFGRIEGIRIVSSNGIIAKPDDNEIMITLGHNEITDLSAYVDTKKDSIIRSILGGFDDLLRPGIEGYDGLSLENNHLLSVLVDVTDKASDVSGVQFASTASYPFSFSKIKTTCASPGPETELISNGSFLQISSLPDVGQIHHIFNCKMNLESEYAQTFSQSVFPPEYLVNFEKTIPIVSIIATNSQVQESEEGLNTAIITISRSNDSDVSRGLEIPFTLTGTAEAGDYKESISSPVYISAGEYSTQIKVSPIINDDQENEGLTETVIIALIDEHGNGLADRYHLDPNINEATVNIQPLVQQTVSP